MPNYSQQCEQWWESYKCFFGPQSWAPFSWLTFNFTPEKSNDVFSILDTEASTSDLSQRSRYLDVQNNFMVVGKLLGESSLGP